MAGEGRPEGGYPRLAGQPQAYLERQLEAYADGRRESVVMAPLARRFSARERREMAVHFSRLERTFPERKSGSKRGEVLATVGDNELRVQACENCHGPGGTGQPPFGPYLAGLHARYLEAEMQAFSRGSRRTDPSGQMSVIARQLGKDDIAALAEHYAGQRAVSP
jgi:cytochrome c553